MKLTRTGKRRAAAINSVKILLTSASLAATVGGWAAISAANGSTLQVAQVDATATVQTTTATSSTTSSVNVGGPATATAAPTTTSSSGTTQASASATQVPATVAPTATAVATQVVVQPTIHTRSSR